MPDPHYKKSRKLEKSKGQKPCFITTLMPFEERHMYKYVKIHEKWGRFLQLESDHFYHISEDDLKKCTIRLLEIAREALMCLVYEIDEEERKKEHETTIPPYGHEL